MFAIWEKIEKPDDGVDSTTANNLLSKHLLKNLCVSVEIQGIYTFSVLGVKVSQELGQLQS